MRDATPDATVRPAGAQRRRLLELLLIASACYGFYLPSSIDGLISRPLSMVALAGTTLLLLLMALVTDKRLSPFNLLTAVLLWGIVTTFTVTSPFEAISPGVAVLYLAQGLLCLQALRGIHSRAIVVAFEVITVVSLIAGYALVADVDVLNRFLVRWYSAFYYELVSNMVLLFDKPVLTFATHSMAGFMLYLFFYMQWRAWRARGGLWHLAAAVGFLGLLVALTSTTGLAFAVVAAAQLSTVVTAIPVRFRPAAFAVGVLGALVALIAYGPDPNAVVERINDAVVGDRVRGLFARYAPDGLLASNMKYLSESPLAPIGLGATDTLFLGDSGLVVTVLRGSLPLLIAVYGAWWLFLRTNLGTPRSALWLWACTVLFEIGFTPLQYFRFLAFAPLLVVYLNTVTADAPNALGRVQGAG